MDLTPLSDFDFHQRLAAQHGLAIVAFTAQGCGACRRMRGVLSAVRSRHPDWSVYEIDAGIDQALTREFDVFHLPALFLYRDGRFHRALNAEPLPDRVEAAVAEAARLPAEEAP